jgi:hypothetical protein
VKIRFIERGIINMFSFSDSSPKILEHNVNIEVLSFAVKKRKKGIIGHKMVDLREKSYRKKVMLKAQMPMLFKNLLKISCR